MSEETQNVASGFNPRKLSRVTVGCEEGWRMLEPHELNNREANHPAHGWCEYWSVDRRMFNTRVAGGHWFFGNANPISRYSFRTKLTHQQLALLDEEYERQATR